MGCLTARYHLIGAPGCALIGMSVPCLTSTSVININGESP